MSVPEYERFIMSPVEGSWELHDGVLVEKPGRTWAASEVVSELAFGLMQHLERAAFHIFFGLRVILPPARIFVPDVLVVPTHYGDEFRGRPDVPAIFARPVPLVAEVWSPREFRYDVDAKIPVYLQRGDLEIWRLHPYERTLTCWVWQADGMYDMTIHRGGIIAPVALPGVTVDFDQVFAA